MSETYLIAPDGRRFLVPSPEEEARIDAGIALDPDSRPLTDEEWARVLPTVKKGLKVPVTMRLDEDVAGVFRASGRGWQTRINEILREWLKTHEMIA